MHCGVCGSVGGHTVSVDAHSNGDLCQAVSHGRLVEPHCDRQEHCADNAVRGVIVCREDMRHCVVDAQADVREAPARDALAKRHFLTALRFGSA